MTPVCLCQPPSSPHYCVLHSCFVSLTSGLHREEAQWAANCRSTHLQLNRLRAGDVTPLILQVFSGMASLFQVRGDLRSYTVVVAFWTRKFSNVGQKKKKSKHFSLNYRKVRSFFNCIICSLYYLNIFCTISSDMIVLSVKNPYIAHLYSLYAHLLNFQNYYPADPLNSPLFRTSVVLENSFSRDEQRPLCGHPSSTYHSWVLTCHLCDTLTHSSTILPLVSPRLPPCTDEGVSRTQEILLISILSSLLQRVGLD